MDKTVKNEDFRPINRHISQTIDDRHIHVVTIEDHIGNRIRLVSISMTLNDKKPNDRKAAPHLYSFLSGARCVQLNEDRPKLGLSAAKKIVLASW